MITTTERQERLLDQHAGLMNPSQARAMRDAGLGIIESRREGPYVWDQSGTRYVDCRQETSVFNIGRRNPDLIATLKHALDEYDIGNSLFFSEPRVHLAERLGDLSPGGELRAVTFGVSGGEVIDFSMKLARAITGRTRVISMTNGYHGSTAFAASASGSERFREPFEPLVPEISFADFGSIESLKSLISRDVACVLLECVQNWAGVWVAPKGYLEAVRKLCDQNGALMVIDEAETAFGRCGGMLALDVLAPGVVPDIVTIGKALSGGLYPVTAALYRKEYLSFWEKYPFSHLSTFAGSDLACVVALETICWIEETHLIEHSKERSQQLAVGLKSLAKRYPAVIASVRSCGLMAALDFRSKELGPQMSRDLSQFGVLASYSPLDPATMVITPTLVVSKNDVDVILDAFARALAGCQSIVAPVRRESLESF